MLKKRILPLWATCLHGWNLEARHRPGPLRCLRRGRRFRDWLSIFVTRDGVRLSEGDAPDFPTAKLKAEEELRFLCSAPLQPVGGKQPMQKEKERLGINEEE